MKTLLAAAFLASTGVAYGQAPTAPQTSPAACPATTQVESTAIARAWHDDVINRRNPTTLREILGPEVVHHAAGGYPKILNAEGVAAMMGDFLATARNSQETLARFGGALSLLPQEHPTDCLLVS
jgi:hypothetical protein